MADYYPLIARAVAGLDKNTGDARRVLYERARAALVAQLRGVSPALNESDVTRERLALEEAIRKVESEAARRPKVEPTRVVPPKMRPPDPARWEEAGRWEEPPPAPEPPPLPLPPRRASAPRVDETAPRPPVEPSSPAVQGGTRLPPAGILGEARNLDQEFDRPPSEAEPGAAPLQQRAPRPRPPGERHSLLDSGLKNFRGVVSEANELGEASARASQAARDNFAAVPDPAPADYQHADMQMLEPQGPSHDYSSERIHEPSFQVDDSRPAPPRARSSRRAAAEDEGRGARRSFRGLAKLAVALLILSGIVGLLVWQWPGMVALYRYMRTPATEVAVQTPATPIRPKIPDRIEPGGQPSAPQAAAPGTQSGPAVAQRVVLYEEDPADPAGKRFVGSAIWRTETVSPGPNQAPELAIRADVEIPERKIAMTWSLRRNTDPGLPASHTVEIMFKLPPDFPSGAISNVPGILMKQAEQTRGVALAGLAVKVTNGFFLIGLSAAEADRERNIQLLKERSWFDIPVVYTDNRRAILALEKGTPGERVFADAFRVWGQ